VEVIGTEGVLSAVGGDAGGSGMAATAGEAMVVAAVVIFSLVFFDLVLGDFMGDGSAAGGSEL